MFDKSVYIIEHSKLAKGHNELEFKADKSLFDEFECEDVLNVTADVKADAVKSERLIEFKFVFSGVIETQCSRCLSPMAIPINKKTSLYVKFGEQNDMTDISEWIIKESENIIDLSNYIYEELRIEIPIAPVHKHKNECNQQMIEKLSAVNEENLKAKESETDPRWAKLAELKNSL
ncbi:MAG: DUF177 domain-containing protein [Bacteroidales bacterium]|nr:DUF177 domain-containing protein [Bacteroidales bacterium]